MMKLDGDLLGRLSTAICSLLVATGVTAQQEELRFAHYFGDHMVLQCGAALRVWGQARPGAEVTLVVTEDLKKARRLMGETRAETLGEVRRPGGAASDPPFDAIKKRVRADRSGTWTVELDPLPASFQPKALLASSGGRRIALWDVLIGEVWLTSGQSNMAWGLSGDTEWTIERVAADHPAVRYSEVRAPSAGRREDLPERLRWIPMTADRDLDPVSAVSYWFAVRLHRYLRVPVGIHSNAVGGTLAEQWTPREDLLELPGTKAWAETHETSDCYDGMIAPITRAVFRGALFFQGENNAIGKWSIYRDSFPALIRSWREAFGAPELPFGIVSLAGFGPHGRDREPEMVDLPPQTFWYAAIRDVHFRTARAIPATGLITTWDLGDTENIHPHRKAQVGWRAARWALARVYEKPVVHTAPVYRGMRVRGDRVILRFDLDPQVAGRERKKPDEVVWHLDYPISREGREYRGFVIAGADRRWYPAKVRRGTEPATLEVWSERAPSPVAVRFGWSGMPDASLVGVDHLPVHPFRTDDWPLMPDPPEPKDSPERRAWDEELARAQEKARRDALERRLRETVAWLQDFEGEASALVAPEDRDALRGRTAELRERLTALGGLLERR
jgi:sialate O-acetylesterase